MIRVNDPGAKFATKFAAKFPVQASSQERV